MEQIQTDRLILRRKTSADVNAIHAMATDPLIYRNVGRIKAGQTHDETAAFVRRSEDEWELGRHMVLAITLKNDVIGVIGGDEDGVHGPYDIGYYIHPTHWNKGYATEATAAFVKWLETARGIKALTAGYFRDNPASGRVLSKLGFLPAGPRKYFCFGRDAFVDCMDMAWISDTA